MDALQWPKPGPVATAIQESGKVPRKPYDRIDALVLVKGAYVTCEISDETVRLATGTGCYVLTLAATLPWLLHIIYLLVIVAALDIIPAVFIARHIDAEALANFVHERFIVRRKLLPIVYNGPYGRLTAANGIRAGKWVCNQKEYDQVCRDHRSVYGRSAPTPLVPYNLVLATYELNRQQQVVAFSDGTSATWHKTAKVIVEDSPEIRMLRYPCDDALIRQLAHKTEELIGFLDDSESPVSLLTMVARLDEVERDELHTIMQALLVATRWNLVMETRQRTELESDGYEATDDVLLQLRQAGEDWLLASPRFQPLQARARRNVTTDPEKPSSINIGMFAGILNVGRKISGHHSSSVYQTQASDTQILSCLEEILNSKQILWTEPELSAIRQTIEEALARQDPRMHGLKQAIIRLRDLCGDLLKGVISNGAYQLLMHFFS
jgi:hypothetical protein